MVKGLCWVPSMILLLSGWAAAAPESDSGARPLGVFVSVLPQKTFVERIGGERHQPNDPHLWTSPPLVRQMAARVRDALTVLDPAQGLFYAAN